MRSPIHQRLKIPRKPKDPAEKYIQGSCSDFLALDGWRRIRTDLPHLRGLGVQERGIADDLYIRYATKMERELLLALNNLPGARAHVVGADAQVMFVEWKSKKGIAAQHQLDWHAQERARGALTLIAGVDFTASIEGFRDWYFKSGLARKVRAAHAGDSPGRLIY